MTEMAETVTLTCERCGYAGPVVEMTREDTGENVSLDEYLWALHALGMELLCEKCGEDAGLQPADQDFQPDDQQGS